MKIHLIALGGRMPDWIEKGYNHYAKRFPKKCSLNLIQTPVQKSLFSSFSSTLKNSPLKSLLKKMPHGAHIIALHEKGELWNSVELAGQLKKWQMSYKNIVLLIGGPDGLPPELLKISHRQWSLSPLTFPHMLIRIMAAEQLYRAVSMLDNHPYHRA